MIDHVDTVHAYTHKRRNTISSSEASERAKRIWSDLQSVFKNEEAWYIIDHELALERLDGAIEIGIKEDGTDEKDAEIDALI
jgi:hypothetical protein